VRNLILRECLKKLLSIILVREGYEDVINEKRRASNECKPTGVRGRERRRWKDDIEADSSIKLSNP
jgi:hypothetical protein